MSLNQIRQVATSRASQSKVDQENEGLYIKQMYNIPTEEIAYRKMPRNRKEHVKVLYPIGKGPSRRSVTLQTWKSSFIGRKIVDDDERPEVLSSIILTGAYSSPLCEPQEPVDVYIPEPDCPDISDFKDDQIGFQRAKEKFKSDCKLHRLSKLMSERNEEAYRDEYDKFHDSEDGIKSNRELHSRAIINQISNESIDVICRHYKTTFLEVFFCKDPTELMMRINKTHSSEESEIQDKVISMLQSVTDIQDNTTKFEECPDHTVLTLGVVVNVPLSIPGGSNAEYEENVERSEGNCKTCNFTQDVRVEHDNANAEEEYFISCRLSQDVRVEQNNANAEDVQEEEFDKLIETEEFMNDESAMINACAKVNAAICIDATISKIIFTDVKELSIPDQFIGTRNSSGDQCRNQDSIKTIENISTLEQENEVRVEQDKGVNIYCVHINSEVIISHMMRLPQGDEVFHQEWRRCGIGDLYEYKLKIIKMWTKCTSDVRLHRKRHARM